jgi:hypothetical protein
VTIAAACRFPEGVVLIADSRVTWTEGRFEDRLQKVLPLGPKIGLAYAGDDIRIPEAIERHIRLRVGRDPRRDHAEQIVQALPRIARRCYREYVRLTKQRPTTSLIFVGVTEGGRVLLHTLEAPDFQVRVPTDNYVVVGSGPCLASAASLDSQRAPGLRPSNVSQPPGRLPNSPHVTKHWSRRRGSGSWSGRCPSLADYVTVTGPRHGAPAAGGG